MKNWLIGDYAAALSAAVKNWFWNLHPERISEKVSLFAAQSSSSTPDSKSFPQNEFLFVDFENTTPLVRRF